MMFRSLIIAVFSVLLPSLAVAQNALRVVATTGMIADTATAIGREHIDVRALMGSGVDPHGYRQTRSDIVALTRADLILWHGLYLEAQMEDFLNSLSERRNVVAVAEAVPPNLLLRHDEYADKFDPHVWMDPALWTLIADRIADALMIVLPEQAAYFEANLVQFKTELGALEEYAKQTLGSLPEDRRVLLTAHDAFAYFGSAYGFEVVGIQGISTESEAGLQRISELVDFLVDGDIGAVFVETSVSDRNIRALVEGAAAQGHDVKIGGELFSDAMGAPETYEGTYLGMIDHNVTVIARALGGQAPEKGRLGKLRVGE